MSDTLLLCQQLIRQASLTPDDSNCQQIIANRLQACGFECEHMPFEDVDNLWATHGKATPLLVFAGHTDVVPTGPETDWTYAPFDAHIQGKTLYGRGAADMKGGLAAMITAAQRFVSNHPEHTGQLGFLLTSDEEGPARYGTVKVMQTLAKRNIDIDYCVVGEPTSTTKLGDTIKVGRRGSLNGKLIITGQQGHIAYPHLANNAIHHGVRVLKSLIQIQWDQGNENFPPTSFQVSNVHAGTGVSNVIPSKIDINFNLRFSPEISVEEIQAKIKQCCDDMRAQSEFEYQLDWQLSGHPFETKMGALIQAVQSSIDDVTGRTPALSTSGGTSDGRFIAPYGVQVIELGLINATIHQVDERIKIQDLDTLSAIYEQVMHSLLMPSTGLQL